MIETINEESLNINEEVIQKKDELSQIDMLAKKYIYENLVKLKSFKSQSHYFKVKKIFDSVQNGDFSGLGYEICFALSTLYDGCILNRGYIYIPYAYDYCWLEIPFHNVVYVFDPCSNTICRKKTYESQYKAKKIESFKGEKIKKILIKNANTKCFNGFKKGCLSSTKDFANVFYDRALKYSIEEENGKINKIKVIYE